MSSMCIIQQSDAVHLITDGAFYNRDGTLLNVASKVRALPQANSVFALRGISPFLPIQIMLSQFHSFDAIMSGLPAVLSSVTELIASTVADTAHVTRHFEITVAGWSDQRQAWTAGLASTMAPCDPEDPVGLSHLPGYERYQPFLAPIATCSPPVDIEGVLGRTLATQSDVDALAPDVDGLALIEAQRLVPCNLGCEGDGIQYLVGGFAELTTVSAAGVSSCVIRVWSDEIGHLIEPAGAEPVDHVIARLVDNSGVPFKQVA